MRGGKRPNSGPKKPMSPYGEQTTVIRIPTSIKPALLSALEALKSNLQGQSATPALAFFTASLNPILIELPIYSGKVSAGASRFPSPAQDYIQEAIDLNQILISNRPATFLFRVKGKSMEGAGIMDGSMVVVNRALKPKNTSIIVAAIDGEWLVKRLYKKGDIVKLLSENPDNPPLELKEGEELMVFGVVTGCVTQY